VSKTDIVIRVVDNESVVAISTVLCQKHLSDISAFLHERQNVILSNNVLSITSRQTIHNYANNCHIN